MRDFLLTNIVMIYKGTVFQKISASLMLTSTPAFFIGLVGKMTGWYLDNHLFIFLAFSVIAIDHFLGTWVHLLIKKDFKYSKNFAGLITKLVIVSLGYTTLSIIAFTIDDIDLLDIYFASLIKLITILYPGSSALSNMSIVTNGKFPPTGLLEKIKNFNKNVDINEFKSNNEN